MRRGSQRIRNVLEAEEVAYREDLTWEREQRILRRKALAHSAGYRMASLDDPLIPYVCPNCGAAVVLSAVELHIASHPKETI